MSKQDESLSSSNADGSIDPSLSTLKAPRRMTTMAIVLGLVVLAAASGMKPDAAGGQGTATPQTAASPGASAEFVYFPGQYVNQATEPTEHIESF